MRRWKLYCGLWIKDFERQVLFEAHSLEDEISAIEPIYNVAREFAQEYDPRLVYGRFVRWKVLYRT